MLIHLFIGWIHEAISFKGIAFSSKTIHQLLLNTSNLTIVFISVALCILR